MSSSPSLPPLPPYAETGNQLMGKYRVEKVLGQGGMGLVLQVKHLALNKQLALKIMLRSAMLEPTARERFLQEGRILAQLDYPHVARVFDTGELETGEPYMVMEVLRGVDLAEVLEQRGRVELEEATGWLLRAIEGLAHAHRAGIVHRDLKPSNLFLAEPFEGQTPSIKVLDFGIAKLGGPGEHEGLTATGAIMGSPQYMAPEQLRSAKHVDGRADIWALGSIYFRLLAGTRAFPGTSYGELFVAVLKEPPLPLRELRSDLPPGVIALVERCLRKEAAERFPSLAELASALLPFASPEHGPRVERVVELLKHVDRPSDVTLVDPKPQMSPVLGARTVQISPDVGSEGRTLGAAPAEESKPRSALYLAAGLAIAVLGMGIGSYGSSRSRTQASPPASVPSGGGDSSPRRVNSSGTRAAAAPSDSAPEVRPSADVSPPPARPPHSATHGRKHATKTPTKTPPKKAPSRPPAPTKTAPKAGPDPALLSRD